MRVQDLSERLDILNVRLAQRESLLEERLKMLRNLDSLISAFILEEELNGKAEQALLSISTKVLGQSTGMIDKMLTTGLQLVFDDQALEFKTEIKKMRGKTAINFQLLEKGRSTPIMESYGGGVLVVAGLLLRVVTIVALNMRRILILDETLSHLSDEYVSNASKLLRKLCDELQFTVLLVTHQPDFATHATHNYRALSKRGQTVFTKN